MVLLKAKAEFHRESGPDRLNFLNIHKPKPWAGKDDWLRNGGERRKHQIGGLKFWLGNKDRCRREWPG